MVDSIHPDLLGNPGLGEVRGRRIALIGRLKSETPIGDPGGVGAVRADTAIMPLVGAMILAPLKERFSDNETAKSTQHYQSQKRKQKTGKE